MRSLYEGESVESVRTAALLRVREWYAVSGEAIPVAFLSRALNRRAGRLGLDMMGLLRPMAESGDIGLILTKRGGYMAYPRAEVAEEYGEEGLNAFLLANGAKR